MLRQIFSRAQLQPELFSSFVNRRRRTIDEGLRCGSRRKRSRGSFHQSA